ncbi:MAG: ScpA family protein [Chamaesiphon sp.]
MKIGLAPDKLANLAQSAPSLKDIGIAILIDLAQRGEIDPWDIQVIDAIDRYLSQLALTSSTEIGQRDADLSESGQAFLWASMLVLLKANTLERADIPEVYTESADTSIDDWEEQSLPSPLDRHLRRRPSALPPQKRPVTLEELIEQLQQIASALSEKPPRIRPRRASALSSSQAAHTIAHLAHNENLTEIAGELEQFLNGDWHQLAQKEDGLDLEELLVLWAGKSRAVNEKHQLSTVPSNQPQPHDRVGIFWALLLLSAQSKVELTQEEFYQDIKIRTLFLDD